MSQSIPTLVPSDVLYLTHNVGATGGVQWPPRSPHDALLSTPGGRDRLRQLADPTSPSPSPIKRYKSTPSLKPSVGFREFDEDEDDDDEDEETLKLQLQEIQARLKLKKLQKARSKDKLSSDAENELPRGIALSRAGSVAGSRVRQDIVELKEQRLERSKSHASIDVPVSPTRRLRQPEIQRSPSRVLLGIDKGLKASNVSLRRAPSLRKASDDSEPRVQRAGGYLQRTTSQAGTHGFVSGNGTASSLEEDRPRSTFSERMANVRTQELERREKDARIQQTRSKAFDIDERDMVRFKKEAEAIPDIKQRPPEFTRDQVVNAYNRPTSGLLQRNKSTSNVPSARPAPDSKHSEMNFTNSTNPATRPSSRAATSTTPGNESCDPSEFESFSSLHLSKRIIPQNVLNRTLAGKKTFTIPDLLKEVTAPAFRLPDVEGDIVLLAVIASKSEPKNHKAKSTNEERGKFMAMTLTDLKWELDLFLFGSGFDKFWKIMPGTVIAILNPGIMPPMKADTGKFSMTLNSSDDIVLEIGHARDLGFCKTVKKDGKTCDAWIDNRHTEWCEFHINETLKKTKSGRMEVNSMDFGKNKKVFTGNYGRKYNSREVTNFEQPNKMKGPVRYDRESHSTMYIAAGKGRSSASLIDDVDVDPDAFHQGSKQERMRKQLAAVEKERDIAKRLAAVGGGLGADYMRTRGQPLAETSNGGDEPPEAPDATALGLLGGKAIDVHLSPMKRKRTGTNSISNNTAMGWGGNLTKELGRMKDGERLQPVKKKTRFVTAKGIREAGRESFGPGINAPVNDYDDDDDLDIVK
jgi:minichromosome maintenance protein 10